MNEHFLCPLWDVISPHIKAWWRSLKHTCFSDVDIIPLICACVVIITCTDPVYTEKLWIYLTDCVYTHIHTHKYKCTYTNHCTHPTAEHPKAKTFKPSVTFFFPFSKKLQQENIQLLKHSSEEKKDLGHHQLQNSTANSYPLGKWFVFVVGAYTKCVRGTSVSSEENSS